MEVGSYYEFMAARWGEGVSWSGDVELSIGVWSRSSCHSGEQMNEYILDLQSHYDDD